MNLFHSLVGALSFAMVNAAAFAESLPAPTVEYSADQVVESSQGTMTQKVYYAQGKQRRESNMGGMTSVTILRPDKKLGWTLMPMQHMYQEMDLAKAREQSGASATDNTAITREGTEVIEGFNTTKYKLVTADKQHGGFIWITDDGIAIQMDMLSRESSQKSRIKMTLKNLAVADQDDALFEIPAGYSKMPSFGGFSLPSFRNR